MEVPTYFQWCEMRAAAALERKRKAGMALMADMRDEAAVIDKWASVPRAERKTNPQFIVDMYGIRLAGAFKADL